MIQYLKRNLSIVMDSEEPKKNKCFFTKLIDSLSDKLQGKKHPVTKKLQELLEEEEFEYESIIHIGSGENSKQQFLMRNFDELIDILKDICEEPKRKEREYEIEVTIERPKRKKLQKVEVYDKITILERWVKIGYKMYRRQFDRWSGDEYIVVDGDVYEIRHDRYGREYLA